MRLLAQNYQLDVADRQAPSAGREAQVVDVRRSNGSMAGRFWVDAASALLLRREVYDDSERLVRSSGLIDLVRGSAAARRPCRPRLPSPTPGRLTDAELAGLRERGLAAIPTSLPGSSSCTTRRVRTHGSKEVLHLSYSDGLSNLSLFAQPGHLGTEQRLASMSTWSGRCAGLGGRDAPQRVVWSGGGKVFTLLSDAPAETVTAVVTALPHDRRRARGCSRASVAGCRGWVPGSTPSTESAQPAPAHGSLTAGRPHLAAPQPHNGGPRA